MHVVNFDCVQEITVVRNQVHPGLYRVSLLIDRMGRRDVPIISDVSYEEALGLIGLIEKAYSSNVKVLHLRNREELLKEIRR